MTRISERLFVWTGGALFVGSLASCAYSYLGRWTGGGDGGWAAAVVDAGLLTVFASHHSLFAREPTKRWLARHIPKPLLRSFYVWIAACLLIATCGLWQRIGGDLYQARGVRVWLHVVVQLLGLWCIARAVRTIDPLELAGILAIDPSTRSAGTAAAAERLQIVGPYRFVRHPLYFGWLLAVFGAPHMTWDRLAFAAVTTCYLVAAIPWEEESLTAEFGEEYERYKRHVRWRLVPYLY